jgi:hypothetical protein
VRHAYPKFIEISMAQIIAQFKPNGTYEPDTCDALLRRFKETAANGAIIAWRHYLETDFGVIGLSRASHVSRIRFMGSMLFPFFI